MLNTGNSILITISSAPYAGSDVVWNALRLAKMALEKGDAVKVFLINEGVDAARKTLTPPDNFFDLSAMLCEIVGKGAEVKYCRTCIDRCGVGSGDMVECVRQGSMAELHDWIISSSKQVTF